MLNLPTIIITALIAVIFLAIVITEIRNRKKGKHSCSCGGSCGSCGMDCSCHSTSNPNK